MRISHRVLFNIEQEKPREVLNRLGADGWELVGVVSTVKRVAMVGNEIRCFFKREGVGPYKDHPDTDAGWGG
jgi:hypothetical protein